jgi:SAM-dependent methyltransferase
VLFERLPTKQAVRVAYNVLLRREPDRSGAAHYRRQLDSGRLTRRAMVETILSSTEFRREVPFTELTASMHLSRCQFVQGFPPARRILDLGGTDQSNPEGALVSLGYPYRFELLTIVDLPPDDRHELYRQGTWQRATTRLGPVQYELHSMTDLSSYPDEAFDLVYSGQSLEHVTEAEGDRVLEGAYRVLHPGGWLCLDTPNGPAWRVKSSELINPDHKIEYGHDQLSAKVRGCGFEIVEAKGLNFVGSSLAEGRFDESEAARNIGVFATPTSCLHLAYICRKPDRVSSPSGSSVA